MEHLGRYRQKNKELLFAAVSVSHVLVVITVSEVHFSSFGERLFLDFSVDTNGREHFDHPSTENCEVR